jgi:hypothetical protein
MDESAVIPGRACGSCNLCCKLPKIAELGKPAGEWCANCAIGKGCRIYDARPQACRGFFCSYLTHPAFDQRWFPATAKLFVHPSADGSWLNVVVDPARPDAWRHEPYYSEIKGWARNGAAMGIRVLVAIGGRVIAVLPDEDADLGFPGEDDRVMFYNEAVGGRSVLKARVEPGGEAGAHG